MSNRIARLARNTVQWRCCALPVLALLAVYVTVLYRRAFAVGVLSDGWVLLEIGSRGFRKAPFVLLTYHTIPVANLLMAALWKLFGLADQWYQFANLAGFVLVGWLLYLLGCALFRQPRIALLASLLFLANSSFYEIPFWPTVGNFQSLAALLLLGGVFAVHRAFHSPRRSLWLLLYSLCGLAAFFTYELAISALGVGFLYALLVPACEGEALSWQDRRRRVLAVLALSAPALALVLGSKLYTSSQGYQAMFLPNDWASLKLRIYLLVRACVALFSLVGADHKLFKILAFGLAPQPGGPLHVTLVALWCLLGMATALFLWQSRCGAVRFLTLWFAGYMVSAAVATPLVSRHFYLGALPASLLMAWLIWRAADAVAARIARWDARAAWPMPEPQTAAVVALLALTLLAVNAKTDLDTAGTLHKVATQATRQVASLVQQRLAEAPASPPRVALVNMPAILAQDGMGAFAFVNGLHPLLQLSTHGRITNPDLFYTYAQFTDGKFANASLPITLSELNRRVRDPASLVLIFDGRTRTVTEAKRTTWQPPAEYDFDSAPFLEWQTGAWPWFRVYAGQPFEFPLVDPTRSWAAVRYLRNPGVSFTVTNGSSPQLAVRSPENVKPSWPVVTFPVAPGAADLSVDPETEVWLAGIWPFAPPAEYNPETASFLPWIARPFPHFVIEEPVLLPVSTARCTGGSCGVAIEYLAERGRDFAVTVEGGPKRTLTFRDVAAPEWRSEWIVASPSGVARVRIEPQGTAPLLLRRLAGEAAGGA